MDDAMVNPQSEMERIPSALMDSSARRAPSPVRRANSVPTTVAIRNGLRSKDLTACRIGECSSGTRLFGPPPFSTAASAFSPARTRQSSEGL